jgi:hypothetical protein
VEWLDINYVSVINPRRRRQSSDLYFEASFSSKSLNSGSLSPHVRNSSSPSMKPEVPLNSVSFSMKLFALPNIDCEEEPISTSFASRKLKILYE